MDDKQLTKFEEWTANPNAAKWLKDTLGTEMGRFFVAVLEERSELRLNAAMPPQFLTANGAAMSGRVLGYEQCMSNIRSLTNPAAVQSAPLVESYGITSPEQATE